MYFLNPGAFWAFSLLLIPILIHLINLRRVKKVYFSNLRFLRDVSQQRKSRTTLRKILILICRILALAFIVLAFSQPVLLSEENEGPVISPIIYFDNSLSLQRTDESGNLLLINGIASVSNFLSALPKGLDVGYLNNDKKVIRWKSLTEVLEEIQEIDYSNTSLSLSDSYDKAGRLQAKHFYIFSDFQKSTSYGLEEILQDTTRSVNLFKLSSPVDKNIYVDSVYLNEPLSISSDNQLNIVLKNTGSEPLEDVLIKLFKDETQLASFTANIGSVTTSNLTLDLGGNSDVTGNYRIELEDSPVVFDNIFYFSINQSSRPRVVILSDGKPNTYLRRVYSNSDYFNLELEDVNNASFQNVINADLLVLDHLQTIPPWLLSQLNQVKGKLLVCPPEDADLRSYSTLLGFKVLRSSTERALTLSVKSLDHPFFNEVFMDKRKQMSLPSVQINYVASGYHEPILEANTGTPFLMRNGSVYFFSSSFNEQSAFSKHALFVPVMYKLAQKTAIDRLYHRLEERTILMEIDSMENESLLQLKNSQNSFVLPVRVNNDGLFLSIPDVLEQPGVYYLVSETDTLRSIAFNYGKKESEIESLSMEELRQTISGYTHMKLQEISDVQEFVNSGTNEEGTQTLWKYALFLALMFLTAELVLLRFI